MLNVRVLDIVLLYYYYYNYNNYYIIIISCVRIAGIKILERCSTFGNHFLPQNRLKTLKTLQDASLLG